MREGGVAQDDAGRAMIERACVICGLLSDDFRCPEHRREERASAAERGYDHKWSQARARYLRRFPRCVVCGARATDVHHVDGKGPLGERGYDDTNWRSLCHACHSSVTSRNRWNAEYDSLT